MPIAPSAVSRNELHSDVDSASCPVKILLASPRGFCAGVNRAITSVEVALEKLGSPLYVRHEIVHNKTVVDGFRARGVIFVDDVAQVPVGSSVVLSAHGSARRVIADAVDRGLNVIDATCPLVESVHLAARQLEENGCSIVLIGHPGHAEVVGTVGQVDCDVAIVEDVEDVQFIEVCDPDKIGYVTQTTLNVDEVADIVAALRARFPRIIGPKKGNICYATKNRQDVAKVVAQRVDVMIIVGSANSSNSNKLRDVCDEYVPSYLVDSSAGLETAWFNGVLSVGISAGASAPEFLVQDIVEHLSFLLGSVDVETVSGAVESIEFGLPI